MRRCDIAPVAGCLRGDLRRVIAAAFLTATILLSLGVGACMPLARQDTAVRVLIFNIHAGTDASGRPYLDAVADLVRSTAADVVLLQEVDRRTRRSGNVDQLEALSRKTGFASAFGRSLDYDGGQYGIAALARKSLDAADTTPLPTAPPQPRAGGAVEPRVALSAVATTALGRLHIVTTHLDASREEQYRLQETAHLLHIVRNLSSADVPLLVGGDFNSEPGSTAYARLVAAGLRDAWVECGSGDGRTYPAHEPVKRIDYLFLTAGLSCTSARVIDTRISDHRPLLVTLGPSIAGKKRRQSDEDLQKGSGKNLQDSTNADRDSGCRRDRPGVSGTACRPGR